MMTGQSLSAAEIYRQFSGGQGIPPLGETQEAARDLAHRLMERTNEIADLVEKVRSSWQGVSADAAAISANTLLATSAEISTNLTFTRDAADSQVAALQTIKNTVKPVGDRPELTAQDVYDAINGKPGYFSKLDQWQADAQHNIDAYASYQSTTSTNTDRIPARYTEVSHLDASVSLAGGPQKHSVRRPGEPSSKPPTSHGPAAGEPKPGAAESIPGPHAPVPKPREPISCEPAPPAQGGSPHRATDGGPSPEPSGEATSRPDATRASSYEPGSPALPPGYRFGPSGQPINPIGSPAFGDPVTGIDYNGSGFPGKAGGGAGNIGAGKRFGTSREPAPPRNTPGTPSTAGKPGNLLGGGLPAKKGEKDTDKEKPAPPYLQETDPDVFGVRDLKPTPPVIGDRPAR